MGAQTEQFKADVVRDLTPQSGAHLVRLLGSLAVFGVGAVLLVIPVLRGTDLTRDQMILGGGLIALACLIVFTTTIMGALRVILRRKNGNGV